MFPGLQTFFLHVRKNKTRLFIATGIILFFIFYSIYFNYRSGYFFYNEADIYLSHFLGKGNFLQKIYDYRITELGTFRGRELATIFNFIDAKFILWSSLVGIPHFLSLTHYIGLLCICGVHLFFTHKYLSRKIFWISFLLVLLFLSSPAPFFSGPYYRTSKILTAVLISMEVWFLFSLTQRLKKNGDEKIFSRLIVIFLVSTGLILSSNLVDEGGYVFAAVFALYPFVNFIVYRERIMLATFMGFCLGMFLGLIYRNFIGPLIISQVLGVRTSLYWSSVSIWNLRNFFLSADLLFQYFRFFWGNASYPVGGVIIYILLGAFFLTPEKQSLVSLRRYHAPLKMKHIINVLLSDLNIVLIGVFATIGILHVMTVNHPLMFRHEVSLLYYTIPFLALFLLGATFAIDKLITRKPALSRFVLSLLVFFVGFNVAAIHVHYAEMKEKDSIEAEFFEVTPSMIKAIHNPQMPYQIFLLKGGVKSTIAIRDRIYFGN